MGGNNFFPTTDAEACAWLTNYALKLPIHGTACGIGAEEIASNQNDLQYYIWMLQHGHPAKQHDAKGATIDG